MPEEGLAPEAPVIAPAPAAPAAETPAEGGPPAETPAENAAPATDPEKPEEITPEQAAKREGRRFGRKLDAAYRRAAEQQARADFLEKRLTELTPKEQPIAGAPKLEQFQSVEEFEAATAKFYKEQGSKEHEAQIRAQAQTQAKQRLMSEWEASAEKAAAKYDDFEQVVGQMEPASPLAAAVMKAGANVAYHLGKHRAEAERIASLEPLEQLIAVGELKAKLASEPAKPKTPSKAPAPITPVSGKSGGAGSELPQDSDDIETWMKKANALSKRQMAGV